MATLLKPRTVFLGDCGEDPEALVESFKTWCAAHAGAVCDLALSSRWVVSCVPPSGADAMTARELRDYAQRQFAHYLGSQRESHPTRWSIATSIEDGTALACAADAELIDGLKAAARGHGVSIRRIFPWWAALVASRQDAPHEVVVAEAGISTAFHFAQGRLHRVLTEFDVDEPPRDAILLSRGVEPLPAVCDVTATGALMASKPWRRSTRGLDFLQGPARASLGSWGLLLVAVVCALLESQRADVLRAAQEREQAMLDRMQASHARVRQPVAQASAVRAAALTQTKALEDAAAMLALQQHPWADVFAGVEAAGGNVAMLGLQHDASQSVIDIELAVSGDDAAWGFAERLASDTRRFGSATLLTRGPLEASSAGMTERARVQATLVAETGKSPDAWRDAR